jgi:5-methyltetrahydropteroyltriglutamate--homocysteine methyltransferase
MRLLTANTGSYPRVGDSPEQQRLRRAYSSWERKEISDEEFKRVQDETTKEVLEEQITAGLDIVTDGQIRWYDQISHFCGKFEGCKIDGLLRFFDTNFYFRQPVIIGRVIWRGPVVRDEFIFAKGVSSRQVKPVVTGPYTLAKLSINKHYKDFNSLLIDFAEAISNEIEELAKAGAQIIQLDEPAILKNEGDFEIFERAIEEVSGKKRNAKLALYTYFGDASGLYSRFQDLPVDIVGLDFTYSKNLADVIEEFGSKKELGLGLIDARNTRMEKEDEVLPILMRVLEYVEAHQAYLNPSCGMEYLPRDVAFAKLKNMVKIAEKAREGLK